MVEAFRCLTTFALASSLAACMTTTNTQPEVYGHRGCRGALPENTIPAFLRATELGVDYLELDVVISADGQVVVSHEPWMSHVICLQPNGDPVAEAEERSFNLYTMSSREIRAFDCGSLAHPDFPEQEPAKAYKPVLHEVLEAVDEHALLSGVAPPGFAIEIKSDPALYGTYQPQPAEFVGIVLKALDSLGITDRCVLQSFDPAILEAIHAERPEIDLSFLIENADGWMANLARLSFTPRIYSPWFGSLDEASLAKLHEMNVAVVVWTVNEREDIEQMIALGVDGIISDHPERVIRALEEN